MNNDEIRAHLEWMKANPHKIEPGGNYQAIEAIETLLAREAEVLDWLKTNCTLPAKVGYGGGAKVVNGNEVIDAVTAILNPERKT